MLLDVNGSSYSSIANNISTIKAMLGIHDFSVHVFDKPKVKLSAHTVQINGSMALSKMPL